MLSKKFRLSRSVFIQAKSHGKNISTPHFSAMVYFRLLPSYSRFSVVQSAKLAKSAVVRNRLRRLIYDYFGSSHSILGADIIIYPKPSMLNLSRVEINSLLDSFISNIHS